MVKMTIADVTYEGSPQELKELLEKFGAKFPVEEEYRKVIDRGPRDGDFIKFDEDGYDVTGGKYYEIIQVNEFSDLLYVDDAGDECYALSDDGDYEVYEKVGVDSPQEQSLKVGDFAKVIDDNNSNNYKSIATGTVEIIEDDQSETPYRMKSLVDGKIKWAKPEHLVKATDEEAAEANAILDPKKARPKVGDTVKAVAETCTEIGTLGKVIIDDDSDRMSLLVDFEGETGSSWVDVEDVEVVDIWAKIGRKPDEFKRGDIVRVIDPVGGNLVVGELYEIDGFNDDVETVGGWAAEFELIAPVESRVDL